MSTGSGTPSRSPSPTPTPTPFPTTPRSLTIELKRQVATNARFKRRLESIEDKAAQAESRYSKIRKTASPVLAGRGIFRKATLFQDIQHDLIAEADRRALNLADPEFDALSPVEKAIAQRTRDRTYTAYKTVIDLVPALPQKLCDLTLGEEGLRLFIQALEKKAIDARGDDVRRLKEELAGWLNRFEPTPQPLFDKQRSNRGLTHDLTGKLLTPITWDWTDPALILALNPSFS
ncbi:hypothetical protein BDN72DRAFT_865509 [Pluteus cervinus]|uniref:Uncharacterized protein n=1 Tax=Pluteus cervinus TaxID=181527 RepID=A0ACD2ZZL4_9AGAR|nr:hypothetical protein BDN72DRAFT_865509 [Pluteus cervinus]